VCDDPQQAKTLAFVSLLVQLITNNQSILSPASAGPISQDRNYFRVIHIIPFQNIQLFLAALRVTGSQQASAQTDRTDRSHYLALPLPLLPQVRAQTTAQRQQQGQNDTGSSADSDVAYSTSPNRAPVLPNQIKVPHGTVCTDELVWTDQQYRPAGGTTGLLPQIPYPYIRVL
jgi:hypothetical protein